MHISPKIKHPHQNFINPTKLYKVSKSSVVFLLSLLSLLLTSIVVLAPASVSAATSSTLNVSAVIDNTLNVSIPTSLVSLNLNPNTENLAKQYIPVTVGTNNEYGYTLTMSASTTSLTRDDSEDNISATLPTLEYQSTGYTDSAFMLNRWGYNKNTAIDNGDGTTTPSNDTNWYAMNNTSIELAKNSTKTNNEVTTVGFAAKVDYDKPAGSYNLDLTFAATPNPKVYYVNYADTSGDASVTGAPLSPASTSSGTAGTGIDLSSSVPTRTGYTFSGWCTDEPTDNATSCSGTKYSAGTNFPITDATETATTLYATWDLGRYTLLITADSNVSSITLRQGSTSGTVISGIQDSNIFAFTGLTYGTSYYLYPVFDSGYEFSSWTKTDSTSGATLGSTSTENTYYTIGADDGELTLESKVSCQSTVSGYMQDFNPCSNISATSGSLTDRRDNQVYTVAKINGDWWMTRNLAIGCNGSGSTYGSSVSSKTLTSTYSNVISSSSSWSTPTALLSAASSSTQTADFTTPRMQCSSTYGAWYNYAAASAGTITGESNDTVDTYNICPAGWTLPTNTQQSGITSYSSAFSPVTGGRYSIGSLSNTGYGYWWSGTAGSAADRYLLYWDGSSLNADYYDRYGRYSGRYVRCVRSS